MTSTTAAGSALAISTGTPATLDRAGYAALNDDEIGYLDKIGTIGRTFGKSEFQALKRAKDKLKGASDYGALTPSMAYDETDPGQVTLRAAAADRTTRLYPVRLTLPSGEIRYFRARVFGAPEGVDGADSIMMTNATIEICTPDVKVPAINVPAPVFTASPTISPGSGTAGVTTFTATDGTATNGTVIGRRWLLNNVAVPSQTGTTFSPSAAQSGSLTVENTATGAGGTVTSTSAAVTVAAGSSGNTLTSANDGTPLTSAIDGSILTSAIAA